jgi:hypothetical protein
MHGFGSTAASAAVAVGRYDWTIYFVQHGLAASHLQDLARTVAVCVVPAHSAAERLKEQLVALLTVRGVAIPQVHRQHQ